jgi:hypothetical protein
VYRQEAQCCGEVRGQNGVCSDRRDHRRAHHRRRLCPPPSRCQWTRGVQRRKNCEIVTLRLGTGRQKMVLERGTSPKLSRRACIPRYGVPSCRGKSAGVAKRPPQQGQSAGQEAAEEGSPNLAGCGEWGVCAPGCGSDATASAARGVVAVRTHKSPPQWTPRPLPPPPLSPPPAAKPPTPACACA